MCSEEFPGKRLRVSSLLVSDARQVDALFCCEPASFALLSRNLH